MQGLIPSSLPLGQRSMELTLILSILGSIIFCYSLPSEPPSLHVTLQCYPTESSKSLFTLKPCGLH